MSRVQRGIRRTAMGAVLIALAPNAAMAQPSIDIDRDMRVRQLVVPEKVGFGRMGVFDGANLGRRGSA